MYEQRWFPQDKSAGAIGGTLKGIAALAELPSYSQFRAGVAYATLNGCEILNKSLRAFPNWRKSSKRWLVSIDYGRTEPNALSFLADLVQSDVRIPGGLAVVATDSFVPKTPFHPKTYVVDDISEGDNSTFGAFVGSGNLTGSGMLTGSECGVLSYWQNPAGKEKSAMQAAYESMGWFESVWATSDPLSKILKPYALKWKKTKPPIVEEDNAIVQLYTGGPGVVVQGELAVMMAAAKAFWIKVEELYKNRGPHEAGNQVDTPRGSRVFFGFPATAVTRNTVLGQVMLRVKSFAPAECSVRFGNNQMDKVNLPVPGTDGPKSYDNSILMFARNGFDGNGLQKFDVEVGSEADLKKWKTAAISHQDRHMQSGRRYGLLF